MDDLISRLSELRCQYNCFDKNERDAYHTLSEAIKALSDVHDTNVGDLISRQAAIDAIINLSDVFVNNLPPLKYAVDVQDAINEVPSADVQPVRWIPVTERLPKSKEEDLEYPVVAVCLDDGSVITACYYESTETWGCGEYYDKFCYPVAWMPLPKPYEGSE